MNGTPELGASQRVGAEELPAEVLADVASVVGADVAPRSRLPGGINAGAVRVQVAGRADAVLKTEVRAHPHHLDETLRARRVVEHMRGHGYPTPAWLGVGATATHVWHLTDFVDAAPAPRLTSRATDLTTLLWHTFQDPLDGARAKLWTVVLAVVGWEGAAVLAATQVLLQLEWPVRLGRQDLVPEVVRRGHRALDELNTLR